MKLIIKTSMLLTVMTVIVVMAACGQGSVGADTVSTSDPPSTATPAANNASDVTEDLEFFEFTFYFNNTTRDVSRVWGECAITRYWRERFNFHVNLARADADPEARLSTMIAAGDLPEVVFMNRDASWRRIVDLGQFVDITDFIPNHPGMRDYIPESTKRLLEVDGRHFTIPQWPNSGATAVGAGNLAYMYNYYLHSLAGSPAFETLEDVYDFGLSLLGTERDGMPVIPIQFDNRANMRHIIYGAHGTFLADVLGLFTVYESRVQFVYNDPKAVEALVFLNRLWRAGLMNREVLTDGLDVIAERLAAGRVGMYIGSFPGMMHNHQAARTLLRETFPDDDFIMIDLLGAPGIGWDDVYTERLISTGTQCISISTNATHPERIFQWLDYLLTPEAALIQIFGPAGYMWHELNDDGLPIVVWSEAEMTETERRDMGIWGWNIPGHMDHIDGLKFAVNELVPPEQRNWVDTLQSRYLAHRQWVADEFIGLDLSVDGTSIEGINRSLIQESTERGFADALMADSEAEARQIIQAMVDFANRNGVAEIEEIYTRHWNNNMEMLGQSFLRDITWRSSN